ncbi:MULTISPECIES: TraI/MobA(P) family conjugative relaxase [unclassified Thalassospira]|uniref:TraI/MobA(P) family conjugative relaxase n=1 Tax=unclassified Thalassospira TaxID=2648997 RepID=UPI000EC696B1|nr:MULTISPECIES: TraI/MobA(P) family conjugative relaxase [unclassified Thalassospira]HAI29880.1 relaxase [Thalassospira sp.]|tara:strand:+ start:13807 stop:14931 length:1125 start_codon:yes stop_codon:yes gene_type:complete
MIATKIGKKSGVPDNYTRLGEYIAAAEEKGEKLHQFWIRNCDAGKNIEDLDLALLEIEAVRRQKPDIADKTYHLVVSFRPGEQDKLSKDDLMAIEVEYAKALGYGDHQRVAGTHINTDNFHMHIAFNKVHPETLKVVTPHRDFKILAKVSREMERKHGLAIDSGMTDGKARDPNKLSPAARNYEAHTWQESFQRHVLKHREEILEGLGKAKTWHEAHKVLAGYDIHLKLRGNGMVLMSPDGQAMKASQLDRSCSKRKLEGRFGVFEAQKAKPHGKEKHQVRAKRRYKPRPLVRHRNTSALWRRYLGKRKLLPRQPGLAARALRSWKMFLLMEAYQDPLAMVLITAHRELLNVFDTAEKQRQLPPNVYAPVFLKL